MLLLAYRTHLQFKKKQINTRERFGVQLQFNFYISSFLGVLHAVDTDVVETENNAVHILHNLCKLLYCNAFLMRLSFYRCDRASLHYFVAVTFACVIEA